MAQRVLLVCDLHDDDQPGAETVSFGIDGTQYEIDVCEEHAGQLRDAVAPYIGAARRSGSGSGSAPRRAGRPARSSGGGADRQRTQEIREWARAQGHQISDRGRIPVRLIEEYDAAH